MKRPGMRGWLARAGVIVASVAALLMMFIGAGDAVSTFFGHPIPGALELAELLMVLVVFLSLPDAEAFDKHIRIDLVTRRLPAKMAARLETLSTFFSLLFYGAMAWQAWRLFADSWAIREYTAGLIPFPVFPAKGLCAMGLTVVTAIALRNLIGGSSGTDRSRTAID